MLLSTFEMCKHSATISMTYIWMHIPAAGKQLQPQCHSKNWSKAFPRYCSNTSQPDPLFQFHLSGEFHLQRSSNSLVVWKVMMYPKFQISKASSHLESNPRLLVGATSFLATTRPLQALKIFYMYHTGDTECLSHIYNQQPLSTCHQLTPNTADVGCLLGVQLRQSVPPV